MSTKGVLTAFAVAGVMFSAPVASAAEVTLKGVAAFQEGSIYATKFEDYIKRVNERGKGLVRINYLGGAPKVMPLFEVGKNLKDGVIDIITTAGSYYGNVLPEAEAMKLIEVSMAELRKGPGFDYMNDLHIKKANTNYIARFYNYEQAHIFVSKPISKPDLSGLKIRVTAMYRPLVETLGGTGINSSPQDVYTMLERGAIDGYGWATRGIFDYSWQKLTKYRIDPAFYNVDISLMANNDVWTKKLNAEQRKLLTDIALEIENDAGDEALIAAEKKKQEEAGIKVIRFSPEDEKKYRKAARDAGWEVVNKVAPDTGPTLRKYFAKEDN